MDEPTSGLDPLMEQAFRETVLEAKAAGQTVFLSSHIFPRYKPFVIESVSSDLDISSSSVLLRTYAIFLP